MSTVHVFVGQCGNQLGTAFLDALAFEAEASQDEEYQMRVSSQHFRPPLKSKTGSSSGGGGGRGRDRATAFDRSAPLSHLPQPRCVMVDMEPKVIEEAIKRVNGAGFTNRNDDEESSANPQSSFFCLAPQQCVTRGEGSGNNWAYGYYEQGESRKEAIAECLRRESESRESGTSVTAYHVVHSVAGGTGSGVGCLVAEVVKDLYPHASLLHSVVWPFAGGEVVTQWLNCVLALSNLRDTADAVSIAYNDVVTSRLQLAQRLAAKGGAKRTADSSGESSISFEDMNRHIGRLWAPLHLPQLLYAVPPPVRDAARHHIQQDSVKRSIPQAPLPQPRRYACMEDVLEALALDPAKKFFTGVSLPTHALVRESMTGLAGGGVSSWSAVLGDAVRTSQETFAKAGTMGFASRGALWLLRGQNAQDEGLRALQGILADRHVSSLGSLFISPDVWDIQKEKHTAALAAARPAHEVALYGHGTVIPRSLTTALQRTEKQLLAGAFTYQYERYGVDKQTFRDCAMRLWDTVHAYSDGET